MLCNVSPECTKDKVPPCPAEWPLKKALKWLENHPIEDYCNREYCLKVDERLENAKAADKQRANKQQA
jgi:hypothetical protein